MTKQEQNPEVILIDPAEIKVDREIRQRTKVDDPSIEELADDIARVGLLHPITIRKDLTLVAGERRLLAHIKRGWKIRAQIFENLNPVTAYQIELSENLKRKNLPWQDEVRAVFVYHTMRKQQVGHWTIKGTADDLTVSEATIRRYLTIGDHLADTEVMACPTIDGAFNLIKGRAERAAAAATNRGIQIAQAMPTALSPTATKEERTAAIGALFAQALDPETPKAKEEQDYDLIEAGRVAAAALVAAREQEEAAAVQSATSPIITASFLDWIETYEGPAFDVLHLDFPYGKDYQGSNTRQTGRAHVAPTYADDPDIYWELLEAFLTWQDKIAYPVAHLMFWFDMQHYQPTIDSITNAGWKLVQPFPLIWHKPYQGVAADPKRRPRHTYETALLFSRGDRKIVRLDQDVFVGRVNEKLHINQKDGEMLKHFLSMLVDEHTAVFDPTCGSGSALAAAKQLGAQRVLGVELDATNAEVARHLLNRESENG